MTPAAPVAHRPPAQDPFDLSLGSPLPDLPEVPLLERDPVAYAQNLALEADARGDLADARSSAWVRLADAWTALHAVAPALDALHHAVALTPALPAVLERLATALPRAGRHREAAAAHETLAAQQHSPNTWVAAARAWLRGDSPGDAARCLAEAVKLGPDNARLAALQLTVARIQNAGSNGAELVKRLIEGADQARRRDDRESWRALSSDAWIESRGALAGDALTEALAASGHPRAAVYVAAETAARALDKGGESEALAFRMLERCARLAETAGLPGEASAAWTVLSLLGTDVYDAREALRDQLAERGHPVELAARLRADARRANAATSAAAWKGVAAIEIPYAPAQAAGALTEALRQQPDDPEAFELLTALASDPLAESALRDSLWSIVRTSLAPSARVRLVLWLAELEERAGDPASAEAALALAEGQSSEAARGRERLRAAAYEVSAQAAHALASLESSSGDVGTHAAESFLTAFGKAPGAFRDARLVARVLAPIALRDDRFASLWTRIAARSDDRSLRLTVLRRLATRCTVASARVRAAVCYAELLDQPDGSATDAAELLLLLLDELPEEPAAASTLAAIAEHLSDPVLSRSALRAVARATADPWERDLLSRFTGSAQGIFAVFASCLADPKQSQERAANLNRLNDLLGDGASILAQRTRLLLVQNSPLNDGLDLARRFSAFDPNSPEAAIAWFGAASLAGEAQQIALAARAVNASLASARDLSSVTRAAVARLVALQQIPLALDVASLTAAANGVPDRSLRAQLLELLSGAHDHPGAVALLEAVAASAADAPEQTREALHTLALAHRGQGNTLGASRAVERLRALWPDATLDPSLLDLTSGVAALAQEVRERLGATLDPVVRRQLHLHHAALQIALHPGSLDEAVSVLDRYADEQQDDVAHGDVTRALLALGLPQLAVARLVQWAAQCVTPEESAVRGLTAARIVFTRLGDAPRALAMLREQLSRDEGVPDALSLAEDIAVEADATAALLEIYDELSDNAAGAHGREAVAYRRASFLERIGDLPAALDAQIALFDKSPTLGASFSAIQLIAEPLGRFDVLVRALTLLADASPTPESRARFYRHAAEVARTEAGDPKTALAHEVTAYKLQPGADEERALLDHARALRDTHPDAARVAVEQVIDEILAVGNQTWDDPVRRAHALHAAELALTEARDVQRVASSVALFMRQHEEPTQGRAEVLALLDRVGASDLLRAAAESAPGMRPSSRPSMPSEAPAPIAPVTPAALVASEPPPMGPTELPEELEPLPDAPVERAPTEGFSEEILQGELPAERVPEPPARVEEPEEDNEDTGSLPPPPPLFPPGEGNTHRTTVPPPPVSVEPPAPVVERMSAIDLRVAASHGDDTATAALAARLAGHEESRDEALSIQRRRFMEDPSRLDALDAMVKLYRWMGMRTESAALETVHAVLSGGSVTASPPPVHELTAPLEGVARVLFPPRWSAFAELGGILWQSVSHFYRRPATRNPARPEPAPEQRPADPASPVGRMFLGGLRLLELPLTTALWLREDVPDGATILLSQPPGVALARALASDTPRTRYLLGRMLEGARPVHTLIAALSAEDAQRLIDAMLVAVGASTSKPDLATRQLAANMVETVTPRALKRIEDVVTELGPRLSYPAWRDAVELARSHAGMLLSGDFLTASQEVLKAHPSGGGVGEAIRVNEHLRELTRFACSEVYLLLRWQRRR